jgi:Domain of unknown function (DUF4290)
MNLPNEQPILLREYGRNIHAMVEHMVATEDKEQRTRMARTIVELMRMLNPEPGNDTADYYHKLWDHLYLMAGYELDIDAPFAKPDPAVKAARPTPIEPAGKRTKNKTYGRNLQLLVDQVATIEDPEARESGIIHIGRLIKGFYAVYNREVIDNRTAHQLILQMSNGALTIDLARVESEGLFNPPRDYKPVHNFQQEQDGQPPRPHQGNAGGKKKFFSRGGNQGGGGSKRKRY